MVNLGKLEMVSVREAWPGEASDFTPWLSNESNLAMLADEVGFEMELIEIESGVGPFRADILARRLDADEKVVIENQFGKTDHNHLGQLLTYAAGVGADGSGAKTIIWIAERFTEPHRAALDWLNKCTEPGIRFFGVELQLWKIGLSPFAPKFDVVSRPNDWQKQLAQVTSQPSSTEHLYLEFWTAFIEFCKPAQTQIRFPSPWARHWLPTPMGRGGFAVTFTASKQKNRLGCELYMTGPGAKSAFKELSLATTELCAVLGLDTEFQELPGKESSRIATYTFGDISVKDDWPKHHAWLKERGESYLSIFTPLVKQLRVDL